MTDATAHLRADVTMIATTIGERHVGNFAALERTAEWCEQRLAESTGLAVKREPYACADRTVRNLYVDLPGTSRPDEILVVGAHYDSVPGSPAANDNGSGVAALFALADAFKGKPQARTIRFVAFVNEEPPYFQSRLMGSLVHAKACRDRGEKIIGMIALETIGCFSDAPNSQNYPPGVAERYPTTGNFIAIVSDFTSQAFAERAFDRFKAHTDVPAEFAAMPAHIPGVGWSDHWSFWQVGYPALMVTDTAPFRYAHYHRATDTPDQIDYVRMAKVVDGVRGAIADLTAATPTTAATRP